jgi:hypothetical protein
LTFSDSLFKVGDCISSEIDKTLTLNASLSKINNVIYSDIVNVVHNNSGSCGPCNVKQSHLYIKDSCLDVVEFDNFAVYSVNRQATVFYFLLNFALDECSVNCNKFANYSNLSNCYFYQHIKCYEFHNKNFISVLGNNMALLSQFFQLESNSLYSSLDVCKFRLLFCDNKCIDTVNYIDFAYFPQLTYKKLWSCFTLVMLQPAHPVFPPMLLLTVLYVIF